MTRNDAPMGVSAKPRRRLALMGVCAAGLGLAAAPGLAQAQTAGQGRSDTGSGQNGNAVAEVIVTAERRAEPLEKVPLAVTAVSGEQIQKSTFENLGDIEFLAPGVQFSGGEEPDFYIRGVGTFTFDYGIEASVGVFVDDVVQANARSPAIDTLVDVDQIQVLKGPQGTLFGKNTSAGAVVVTTGQPQFDGFEDTAHLSYGSYNEIVAQDVLNVPISDTLALRIDAGYMRRDGFIRNVVSDGELYAFDDSSLRVKLLWKPNNKLSVYVIGDYENHWDNGNLLWTVRSYGAGDSSVIFVPPLFIKDGLTALGVRAGPNNAEGAWNAPNFLVDHNIGGQVDVNYDFDNGYAFKSITAFEGFGNHVSIPVSSIPQNFFNVNDGFVDSYQSTQEFRIISPTSNRFEWVGGIYLYDLVNDAGQTQAGTLGLIPYGAPFNLGVDGGGDFEYHVDSRSYAAYGQGTYHVTSKLGLIVGARYTYDDLSSAFRIIPAPHTCQIDYFLTYLGLPGGTACLPPTEPFHGLTVAHGDWSGRVGLQYDLTRDVMGYVTVARGYKGPTVNNIEGASTQVFPETSIDYEAGVKSQLFDRRLVLNLDIYYDDFTDFQTQVYDTNVNPATFEEGNAGGLLTEGVEGDFSARVTHDFGVTGGFAYDNAVFTNFETECDPTIVCGVPVKNAPGIYQTAGAQLPGAPKWTFTLAGDYKHSLPNNYLFEATVNAVYKSKVYFEVNDPNTIQEGYAIVNATAGFGPSDGRWKVSVFARNLFNQHYWISIFPNYFDSGGYANSPDPSGNSNQTIGVALDVKLR